MSALQTVSGLFDFEFCQPKCMRPKVGFFHRMSVSEMELEWKEKPKVTNARLDNARLSLTKETLLSPEQTTPVRTNRH